MIEKRHEEQPENITYLEATVPDDREPAPSLITPILRRWYIVLITALVICAVGIPSVWLLIKPAYAATAAISVAPTIPSILFGDRESNGVLPMYRNFVNTQADLITSDHVLQRVADDLMDKNLTFFKKTARSPVEMLKEKLNRPSIPDMTAALRAALVKGKLVVKPDRNSLLIKITMQSSNLTEAVQIVNSFVRAYMAIAVSDETRGGDQKLSILENERRVLADKLQRQRDTIRRMAEEYGTTILTDRQEIKLQRVASLQEQLTKIQARKLTLEAQQQLLGETAKREIPLDKLLKMRYEFINANPTIQVLSNNITQLEQGLIVAKQTLAPANPELKRKAELIEALKVRLQEKRRELNKTFDDITSQEIARSNEDQLDNAKAELQQMERFEERLQNLLAKENSETIELGRKHLAIQDQQEQKALTKELYNTVRKRIQELEMERKRPARISVAYNANVAAVPNKRLKYTIAMIFGSVAAGMFLAVLLSKSDHSLYTPQDITKRIGARIIGTTASADYQDVLALPQQIAVDYQTIRANLSLLDGGRTPRKIVITSPGTRDGKTTFAINLATSLARSGKKVLLVDGDLRKPDIRGMLNLPVNSAGIKEVLSGRFEDVVHFAPSAGFDVLTANSRDKLQAFELLSKPDVGKNLDVIGTKYDHLIIDTPPVLAFPDALLWAKVADGVILTSFAGHTNEQDLKETLERLTQIKANVLGTILNNVSAGYSYNRYGYSYYTHSSKTKKTKKPGSLLPLLGPEEPENSSDSANSQQQNP